MHLPGRVAASAACPAGLAKGLPLGRSVRRHPRAPTPRRVRPPRLAEGGPRRSPSPVLEPHEGGSLARRHARSMHVPSMRHQRQEWCVYKLLPQVRHVSVCFNDSHSKLLGLQTACSGQREGLGHLAGDFAEVSSYLGSDLRGSPGLDRRQTQRAGPEDAVVLQLALRYHHTVLCASSRAVLAPPM